MIDNPEYKGPWSAKRIENPEYKGEWEQKTMDNPDYVGGYYAYDSLAYVGFELWVVNNGSIFDNILVTDDLEYAKKVGAENFTPISEGEKDVQTAWKAEQDAIKAAEEEAAAQAVGGNRRGGQRSRRGRRGGRRQHRRGQERG